VVILTDQIAILVENDFHDLEFWYPYYRLLEADYRPLVVAPLAPRAYSGKYGTHIEATYSPSSLSREEVMAVVIPGGMAPDKLRLSPDMVSLVKDVYAGGGLIAAICHAGSLLVSAGILKGKRVTSYPSIRDDMVLAGAQWVDEPVVVSQRIITSRRPGDLPYFAKAILKELR